MLDARQHRQQRLSPNYTAAEMVAPWPYVEGVFSTEYPLLVFELERILCIIASTYNAVSLNDVGCGSGWLLPVAMRHFPTVRAFDEDSKAISAVRKNYSRNAFSLRVTPETAQEIPEADVFVFNHLFYYIPITRWEAVLAALNSRQSRTGRIFIIFSMWSRNCASYQLGALKSGIELPSAEDLYAPISATGGRILLTSTIEAKHFVPQNKLPKFRDFLSLESLNPKEIHPTVAPLGRCIDLTPHSAFAWLPSLDVTTVAQRDLIVVAEYALE